ncbi:hypothetical protein, partial [Mycolicibacterium smegmatis]|uniref:hypothetical protein n=1 Tax=Mycolicibacterium smegmatis TaxID=1772 RepID=UPI001E604CEA
TVPRKPVHTTHPANSQNRDDVISDSYHSVTVSTLSNGSGGVIKCSRLLVNWALRDNLSSRTTGSSIRYLRQFKRMIYPLAPVDSVVGGGDDHLVMLDVRRWFALGRQAPSLFVRCGSTFSM